MFGDSNFKPNNLKFLEHKTPLTVYHLIHVQNATSSILLRKDFVFIDTFISKILDILVRRHSSVIKHVRHC